MRKLIWLFLFVPAMAFTQVSNPSIISVATAPTGSCSAGLPNQQVVSTGVQYSCQGGTWAAIGSGTGGPFLPLAGGTLTGALNGTDGNFSGTVAVGTTNPVTIGGATGSCAGQYAKADGTGCGTPFTAGGDLGGTATSQTVIGLTHVSNAAVPVNVSAPSLTLNSVANATAPTGVASSTGGTVPASTINSATITCLDSGGNSTYGIEPSAAVVTTGSTSSITWSYTIPTGCATAYIWMRAGGSFGYYSVATGTSFTQTAAYTTYTPAASYPANYPNNGIFPYSNATGIIYGAGGVYFAQGYGDTVLEAPGSHLRLGWNNYPLGVAASNSGADGALMAITTTNFLSQGVGEFSWAPSANLAVGPDTGLSRVAAGVVGVGNGVVGNTSGGLALAKIINTGTAPTTSAGTVAAYSTNAGGEITGLSAATSVTITFANSGWTNAAFCVANSSVAATQPYVTAQSNTAVTFTFPALTGNLFYHCDGN